MSFRRLSAIHAVRLIRALSGSSRSAQTQAGLQRNLHSSLASVSSRTSSLSRPWALANTLIVTRKVEWATVLVGFEEANRYTVLDGETGDAVLYIAEDSHTTTSLVTRQLLHRRRPLSATVMDAREGNSVVCTLRRPMHLVTSATSVERVDTGELLGEVKQVFSLIGRKYELFDGDKRQVAAINGQFLAWDFGIEDEKGETVASVSRNFSGLATEMFTDAGAYVLRFEPHAFRGGEGESERLLALAACFSIDFDHFSQHSGRTGVLGGMPIFMPMPMPTPTPMPTPSTADGDGGTVHGSDSAPSSSEPTSKEAEEAQADWEGGSWGYDEDMDDSEDSFYNDDGIAIDDDDFWGDGDGGDEGGFFESISDMWSDD